MKRHRFLTAPVLAGTLVLGVLGKSTTARADAPVPTTNRLLIYHAWDSPSEIAALQALLDRFQATNHDATVSTPAVHRDPKNLFPILQKLVAAGRAPEAFHAHAGYGAQPYFEGGLLTPLDEVWATERLASVVPPVIRGLSQIDGHYYSVPIGIHRVNLIWYNKPLLDRYHIEPSTLTTWDQFFKAAALLRTDGVASPISMGEAWTGSAVFQSIVASLGMGTYEDWANGKFTAPDDPGMLEALKIFGTYLGYVNPDHADLSWDRALRRVRNGEAAFGLMGDWANGEFRLAGKKYGKDYGAMPAPGTQGMYGVAVDTFLRPLGVLSPTSSERWLRLVASREGQDVFNVLKGSIPARNDADISRYDLYQKSAIADLKRAKSIYPAVDEAMPDAYRAALSEALARFAVDRDAKGAASMLARTADQLAGKYKRTWSLR